MSLQRDWQNLKLNWNYTIPVSLALFLQLLLWLCFPSGCHAGFWVFRDRRKKKKRKIKPFWEHTALLRTNWSQIKIFCSKGIAYFYYSFSFPHSSTFHDPITKKFMILHVWLPYSFIETFIFSFILLKGKVLKWYPSCFLIWFISKGKINVSLSCVSGQLAKSFISLLKIPPGNFK